METEVLIVGAGPTGLAAAIVLRQVGINAVLVEKRLTALNTSRAAVIHAHTLEMLEPLGVSSQLMAAGLKLAKFTLRDRDRELVRLRFDALPSDYACLLMLPQDITEKILGEALVKAAGAVRWGHAVEAIKMTDAGIEATIQTDAGQLIIRARYVIGADGMHSLVRQTAGINFTGASYDESFVLADVELDWRHGSEEVLLFFSPAGLVVVAPLPGGRYRIVATLDDAPAEPGRDDIQRLLDTRGPTTPGRVVRVEWSSRFRLHHRLADHYRSGPMFLIGDAAHVHSPAGGQGMNTGLVDACVLGRLLADVISGRRPERDLDQYETLRRPAAQEVLELAGRMTSMATMKGTPQRWARNVSRLIGKIPPVRHRLEMNLSGLSRRAAARLA